MPLPSNLQPRTSTRLRICVLGTRGFPNVQGGIETHCEHLYPEIVKKGCEVIVFTRKPYVIPNPTTYSGVTLVPLSCPKNKYFETIIHTFKGVFSARKLSPDILHIHGIGPSLLVPLARFLGMKVVVTHHGPDYKRKKWGFFAKLVLKIGEWAGTSFANETIAIADNIAEDLMEKYGNKSITIILNGVHIPKSITTYSILRKLDLEKNKYILAVGRFVPEKGFHDLIEAFNMMQDAGYMMQGEGGRFQDEGPRVKSAGSQPPTPNTLQSTTSNWKLVIVGDADHQDKYSKRLKELASNNSNIILPGFLTGLPLQELYRHAKLFVLPSHYEGLPIALLEAMSHGLSCIVSTIPAHKNISLSNNRFFTTGNVKALCEKLEEFINSEFTEEDAQTQIHIIAEKYNWGNIADNTLQVYDRALKKLKIAILGAKGIPTIYGGVERHVEEISTRLVAKGHQVTVYCRNYYTPKSINHYKGVNVKRLPSIKTKRLDTITHVIVSSFHIMFKPYDIIHLHSIGPSTLSFIMKIKINAKLVITVHALDWMQNKWKCFDKLFLKLGERFSIIFSDTTIVVSKYIHNYFVNIHSKDTFYIPNGALAGKNIDAKLIKDKYGLQKDGFLLTIGRLIPERKIECLIDAFKSLNINKKLVIIGGSSFTDQYVAYLKSISSNDIIFTGYIASELLNEFYSNSLLYIHPSEHEGLPISLLDAMAYGNCVIASNIEPHREIIGSCGLFFPKGNSKALRKLIFEIISNPSLLNDLRQKAKGRVRENYDWNNIVDKTEYLYLQLSNHLANKIYG